MFRATCRLWPLMVGIVAALALAPVGPATASEVATGSPVPAATPVTTVLTLRVPVVCSAREATLAVATLEDSAGVPIAGQPVSIVQVKSTTETVLAVSSTDASGHASAKIAPTSRIVLRARFAGSEGYSAAESELATLTPRAAISKPWTHDAFAYPGQWLPARGTVWPRHSKSTTSTTILCERREKGAWVLRATYKATITTSGGTSRYSGKFRVPSTGTWRVRVRHADAGHAQSTSAGQTMIVTRWRDRYFGHKMRGFKTKKKLIAITIDDGPNGRTLEICRILEKYGARATFFFTDQLLRRGNEKQAKQAYDRGHEIANHTATHSMLTGSYSHSLREATLARNRIAKATGFTPIWIRAMGGGIDRTGMRVVVDTGQLYCNWSIDSYDSHRLYTPPDTLYRNVIRGVRPGAVILLHQTHPESVKALPRICRELKRRGYKMVTLSKLASESTRY